MPTGCRLDAHLISLPKSHIIILALSPFPFPVNICLVISAPRNTTLRAFCLSRTKTAIYLRQFGAFRRIPSNFAMAKDSPFATVYFSVRRSKSLAYSAPRSLAGLRGNAVQFASRSVSRSIDRSIDAADARM